MAGIPGVVGVNTSWPPGVLGALWYSLGKLLGDAPSGVFGIWLDPLALGVVGLNESCPWPTGAKGGRVDLRSSGERCAGSGGTLNPSAPGAEA